MTKKHFQAILAKNEIATMLGKFMELSGERRQLTNGDIAFLNSCLSDIEDFIGTANQPDRVDSFRTGQNNVKSNPGYYGEEEKRA